MTHISLRRVPPLWARRYDEKWVILFFYTMCVCVYLSIYICICILLGVVAQDENKHTHIYTPLIPVLGRLRRAELSEF